MLTFCATMSKQRSTLSKGRNFNAKLVRHCCRFWQQSRTLLRHCCWCGPGFRRRQSERHLPRVQARRHTHIGHIALPGTHTWWSVNMAAPWSLRIWACPQFFPHFSYTRPKTCHILRGQLLRKSCKLTIVKPLLTHSTPQVFAPTFMLALK